MTQVGDTRPSPTPLERVPLASAGGDALTLHAGQRLGPFELRELLGSGGMGQVFLADQLEPVQRPVALKFMHHRLMSGVAAARFEIERQALARMSHPAIAQVFEAGTTADGYPYLAMEYVPGEPIDDYCKRRGLSLRARIELYIRVALGVQHAHQKHIVHLDLKPANVLVSEVDGQPQPKIIDFGLAASSVGIPGQRSGVALAGTPGYMSPEQAGFALDDDPAEVDARSDVYALGVVLYQLVADASPFAPGQFSSVSTEDLRRDFANFAPLPPSERLRAQGQHARARLAAGDLDAVVAKAMQRARTQRYESVAELIDDLRRVLAHREVRARPASRAHRLRLYWRRNRRALVLGGALGLSLLIALLASLWSLSEVRAERDQTAARQRELERVTEFQQSMLESLDPALLGQTLQQTLRTQLTAALAREPDAAARLDQFDRDLALANPTEAARQMLDADLLKRALAAVERELDDQPLVAAELQLALAGAWRGIGRFEPAQAVADSAAAHYAAVLGAQHPKTLRARLQSLQMQQARGQSASVLPALMQLADQAAAQGEAGVDIELEALRAAVEIRGLESAGLAQAREQARTLLERYIARYGDAGWQTAYMRQTLGVLAQRGGDFAAATPLFQAAWEQLRQSRGEEFPETINSQMMLAANLDLSGDTAAALPLLQQVLSLRRRLNGNEHPLTLTAMNGVAVALSRSGQLQPAIALAEEAYALRQRTLGADHPQTLRTLLNLGSFYALAGDVARARTLTRQCYERRLATLGPDNADVYGAGLNLADFELIAGDPREGLRLATEARDQRIRLYGADAPAVALAQSVVARALVLAGPPEQALAAMQQQWAEVQASPEDYSERHRSMRAWYLAQALLRAGRPQEAQPLLDQEMDGLLQSDPARLNPPEREALRQLQAWLVRRGG